MITTVTLNTALDRTLVVPNFLVGRRHRASRSITLAGGRGVTIARTLHRLGRPVIATGFAGGLTGSSVVRRLTREGLLHDFVTIEGTTRTSTAVIDPVTGVHTEINEHGPMVSDEEARLLADKLSYLARASRCVVLAGSLPRGMPDDTLQRLLKKAHAPDLVTVITCPDDTDVLRAALVAEPTVVVIEQREAEALVGHEFGGDEDFLMAVDELGRAGVKQAIVVHSGGCYVRIRQGRTVSYIKSTHDPLEAVSELGTTEAFVAGYLHSLRDERTPIERVPFGMAVALANTRHLGAGTIETADVPMLLRDVTTESLDPAAAS